MCACRGGRAGRASLEVLLGVGVLGVGLATGALGLVGAVPVAGASRSAAARPSAKAFGVAEVRVRLGNLGAAAAGSGLVLTSHGELLTDNHVIRGATRILVRDLGSGRTYAASVRGYDVAADVAVLALKGASGLGEVPIGAASSVRVGARVRVVGSTGAGRLSVSAPGRVLALHQAVTASPGSGAAPDRLVGLVEQGAAVAPASAGGALVDAKGLAVGLVTATSNGPGSARATRGFAVPIDRALAIARRIEEGRFSSAVHGPSTAFLGVDVLAPASSGHPAGVPVAVVVPASPAARAGLVPGDRITSFAGRRTDSAAALAEDLLAAAPGARVGLAWVSRQGVHHRTTVRLGSGPPQ